MPLKQKHWRISKRSGSPISKGNDDAFALFLKGDQAGSQKAYVGVPFDGIVAAADSYLQLVNARINRQEADAQDQSQVAIIITVLFSIVAIIITVLFSIVSIILGITISLLISASITRPLAALQRISRQVTDGDLTSVRDVVEQYPGRDEMCELIRAQEAMITRLHELAGVVTKLSKQAAESANQIAEATHQTGQATEQVAMAIQNVADGAQQQASELEAATKEVDQLDAMSQSLQQTSVSSETVMTELREHIHNAADRLKALQEHSAHIGQIIQTIDEIAGIIELALKETAETGQAMQDGVARVENAVHAVSEARQGAELMAETTTRAHVALNKVAVVSEGNSAAAEEVSASAEEMTANMQMAIAASQVLAQIADELYAAAKVFRWRYLDEKPTQKPSHLRLVPSGTQRKVS